MGEDFVQEVQLSRASTAMLDAFDGALPPPPSVESDLPPSLLSLYNHDCLLQLLQFLPWEDLNTFAITSKQCRKIRNHDWLDQTRSGTIRLNKANNVMDFMEQIQDRQWSQAFCGQRTHLRLTGLTELSSGSDHIDFNRIARLKEVTSLDCSLKIGYGMKRYCSEDVCLAVPNPRGTTPPRMPLVKYVDSAFSLGLALSLIVPNLKQIDISKVPLTSIAVSWLAENNPNLKSIRWNKSYIWPINNDSFEHIKACQNLEEVYLDGASLVFCHDDMDPDLLWACFASSSQNLRRISLQNTMRYRNWRFSPLPQLGLMKLVRNSPSLQWFRSDLTPTNVEILRKERPDVTFCS
jgi:hypothetical protein